MCHNYYKRYMLGQIKKSHFRYVKCAGGDLHDGEVMNLVCVDSLCSHRGLICPICRMESHQNHYIMPIKTFIDQINNMFMQSSSSEDLNNLQDYLRKIEATKKSLINQLKSSVTKLADTFKEFQVEIQLSYNNVRKNVLAQSSMTTKLPNLVQILAADSEKDGVEIQKEFAKYCQLLKYQNSQIKFSDKAKLIVEDYAKNPDTLKKFLNHEENSFIEKLKQASKMIGFQEKKLESLKDNVGFSFSTKDKTEWVLIEQNNTQVKIQKKSGNQKGFAFVDQEFGPENRTIALKIIENDPNNSESVLFGVAKKTDFEKIHYKHNESDGEQISKSICFVTGAGQSSANMFNNNDSESQSFTDCFYFSEKGCVVEITLLEDNKKLKFVRKDTSEEYILNLNRDLSQDKDWKFVVGLTPGDTVQIQKKE